MPDELRERYLAELDELLPMPPERRAEVLEEISAHLDDAADDFRSRGRVIDGAEAAAQARLGSPRLLALELAKPEQTAWRLLAAAGAGVRTGVGQWIYGYLLGSLTVLLSAFLVAAVVQIIGSVLRTGWTFQTSDNGWNSLLTASAAATGLYFAGRAMPEVVSVTSRRPFASVRPWVVAVSTAAAATLLIMVVEVPHNWASIVGFILAPAAVALGAYRPGLVPARVRPPILIVLVLFIGVPILGLAVATGGSSTADPIEAPDPGDRGLSIVGPWLTGPMTDGEPIVWSTSFTPRNGHAVRYEWEVADPRSIGALRDLRVEAWRSTGLDGQLDATYREPFATAAVTQDGHLLHGDLVTTREPGIAAWELILTGVADDGVRYVLDAGTVLNGTFTGTVWDWMAAVTD